MLDCSIFKLQLFDDVKIEAILDSLEHYLQYPF